MGFEPTRLLDNGFQDRRINRSATCANLPGWNWTNTLRLSDVRSNHLSYRQKKNSHIQIPRAGFEPAPHRLKAGHSTFKLTRVYISMATGLEPIPSDLKSNILPIKLRHQIGQDGIEPSSPRHERDTLPIKLLANINKTSRTMGFEPIRLTSIV